MPILNLDPGKLSETEVIRLAGGGVFPPDSPIQTVVKRAITKGHALVEGTGTYVKFPAENTHDGILIHAGALNIDPLPFPGTTRIYGVEAAVFFVVTIGHALEREVDLCFLQRDPVGALFLDAVGSVAAEAVADRLTSVIASEAEALGFRTSSRCSPGYCNWSLEIQKTVFRVLDGNGIGVELTDSMLMIPRKSISGVVFLGKNLNPLNPCKNCKSPDCKDRRS